MNSAQAIDTNAGTPRPKLAAPDSSWTFKESGLNSSSFTSFDSGHEEQSVNTGTRAYFDRQGGEAASSLSAVLTLISLPQVNKRIVKAVTTTTKKVVFTVLYDSDTQTVHAHSAADLTSTDGSTLSPPASATAYTPSPAVVVAAALAAQGTRSIDQYFIPHGSANSTSRARSIVRRRTRASVSPASSIAGSSSSVDHEHFHGPRPRPLHIIDDDAQRPTKKRKRSASADVSTDI